MIQAVQTYGVVLSRYQRQSSAQPNSRPEGPERLCPNEFVVENGGAVSDRVDLTS
jgi:hypothetical protein